MFCSCGAQLPDDARFCHRCGKSQRPEAEEPAPAAPAPVASIPEQARTPQILAVDFRNPIAVRISLMVASFAAMLNTIPFLNLLFIVWSMGAGFLSVVLYRRRTGQMLSVGGGAKLGWITGVWTFLIEIVLFTITLVASGPALSNAWQALLARMAAQDPNYPQAAPYLESPYALAIAVFLGLAFLFCVFAASCVAGGALGARIGRRDSVR